MKNINNILSAYSSADNTEFASSLIEFIHPKLSSADFAEFKNLFLKALSQTENNGFKKGAKYSISLLFDNEPDFTAEKSSSPVSNEEKITSLLLKLGIPANLLGYSFIRDSVLMALETPEVLNYVTKELYPNVAKMHHTKPNRVERAIRHAIEITWAKNSFVIDKHFKNIFSPTKRPSNSEFIAVLADIIKFNM